MHTMKRSKRRMSVLKKLSTCLLFALFSENCFSYSQINPANTTGPASSTSIPVQDSVLTPPTLIQPPTCSFNFEDNYFGADSAINLPTAPYETYSGNNFPGYFGQVVQLMFNNYNNTTRSEYTQGYSSPTPYTPNVPCDGHYEVSFSIELRNNSGTACNYGENSMSIWSTTTDPASPNAYGCPVSYLDSQGHARGNPTPFTVSVHACATFSQWVQCAWTNNFSSSQESTFNQFEYYGVQAFPIFMYTANWPYVANSPIQSQYPSMCPGSLPNSCSGAPGQFLNSYQTAFCSSKTFNFKNVVYLHAGAQILAPVMASQQAYTPWSFDTGGYAECSFSVVGGKFKVVYLGP